MTWALEPVQVDRSEGACLHQYRVGPGRNFVYLLADPVRREAVVVDPAWDPGGLVDAAATLDYQIVGALLTHTHSDHMGGQLRHRRIPGVAEMLEEVAVPVWVHECEAERLELYGGVAPRQIRAFDDGHEIAVGALGVTCLHTPGHTPGGSCYLAAGCLLSGDTLFVRNVGNVEHVAGDVDALYASLRRLERLPAETRVYPGHDYGDIPSSTIAREKQLNAYMRRVTSEQFRVLMGFL